MDHADIFDEEQDEQRVKSKYDQMIFKIVSPKVSGRYGWFQKGVWSKKVL